LIIVLNSNVNALTVNFTSSASGTSNTICKNQNLQLFVDADLDFDFWIEYRNTSTGNNWIRLVTTQQSYILGGSSTQVTGDKVNSSDYRIIALDNTTVLASLSITVNPLPTITTTGTLSALCYSTNLQSATLSYSATTYTPTSYSIDWNAAANTAGLSDQSSTAESFFGSGGNLTINIASSVVTGTYNGSLIISNSNGCSSTKAISILIKPLPIVTFIVAAALNECQNSEVTYTTQAGKTNYQWSTTAIPNTDYIITNGGLGLTNNTVSLKWLKTGTKTIQVNYTDANSCTAENNQIASNTVTVNPLPTVTITKAETSGTANNDAIICKGATITLSGVGASSYSWTGGISDGVAFSPTTTTTYTVTGTDINSCSNTLSQTVSVNVLPTVTITKAETSGSFNNDAIICKGATITLSGVGASTYSWTGGISDGVAFSPTTTTAYTLTGTDINSCSSTLSQTVSVNVLPSRPTIISPTICEGQTTNVSMSLPTGTYTYTWTVPTGVASSTTKTVSTSKAGTYSLTITDANSCTSEVGTASVTVNPLPAKPTLTSSTICEGQTTTVSMSLPAGTYTYTWIVPTGVASSTTNTVSTSKAGTYSLTITDANSCTSDIGTGTVTVNPLPAKPTLTSSTICEGQTTNVSMSLPAGTYTYTWIVPTGVATSTTKTISTSKAGTYSLTITDANSCTSDIGTGTVTVNTLPTKPTLTSATICDGETATVTMLTPTGTNTYTYTWTVPTGVATSTTKTVSTNKAGTYSLTITDVNSCTSEVGTGTVTVNPLPTLTITNPAAVCAPGTIDLTATTITAGSTASLTYTYFTNATATNTLTNTSLIGASGTYYIKGTSTLNCSAIQPVNTIINPIPSFNILSPSVCVGSVFTININPLSGTSSDYNYTWVVPTGVANPGNVSNFTTTIPGVYTATIKNKSTNCESAALNNSVTFYPLPTAAAIVASDNKVMEGATLNLTAAASGGTGAYLYTWVPNSTTNYTISGGSNALFNALREGTVNIKYQVKDANNCSTQSADFVITITPATIIFEIPNAFTPNGDGMNDELKIISNAGVRSLTSFKIFSRSGNLVFESRDLSRGWDGRYNGNLLPADIYYWTAVYVDRNNVTNPKNGTVLLLK